MAQLLREYVKALVERIRSRSFDMKTFQSLPDLDSIIDYAIANLEELGLGTSRAAYLLNSKYVIKVAQNKRGLGQNEAEFNISKDPETGPLVTRVVARHPKFYWIMSELVRPLASEEEFEKLTGISFETFVADLEAGNSENPFINSVLQVSQKTGLELQDLMRIEHWGKTAYGHVVLLDSGYTTEVKNTLYRL